MPRLEEVYSGSRTDPEFWEERQLTIEIRCLEKGWSPALLAQYCFTYHASWIRFSHRGGEIDSCRP